MSLSLRPGKKVWKWYWKRAAYHYRNITGGDLPNSQQKGALRQNCPYLCSNYKYVEWMVGFVSVKLVF